MSYGRDGNDWKLSQVHEGGAAHAAGLSAGDVLMAIDGLRVTAQPDGMLARYAVGDAVVIHAFRRDELMSFNAELMGDRTPAVTLTVDDKGRKGPKRPSV